MITQLLNITSVPIKYELEIQRAKLEYNQDFQPRAKVETKYAKIEAKTKNAALELNTYEARRSLGQNNLFDWTKMYADKGMESITETTGEYVEIGNEMSRIHEGVTIAQIFAERVMGEQPVLYTAFLPNTGVDITFIPQKLDQKYLKGDLQYDWQIMRDAMNYVPGSVRMTILQMPSIEIEYLGQPHYVPPSADPEYTEPEG